MTNTQAWDYAIGMIKVDGLEATLQNTSILKRLLRMLLQGKS